MKNKLSLLLCAELPNLLIFFSSMVLNFVFTTIFYFCIFIHNLRPLLVLLKDFLMFLFGLLLFFNFKHLHAAVCLNLLFLEISLPLCFNFLILLSDLCHLPGFLFGGPLSFQSLHLAPMLKLLQLFLCIALFALEFLAGLAQEFFFLHPCLLNLDFLL